MKLTFASVFTAIGLTVISSVGSDQAAAFVFGDYQLGERNVPKCGYGESIEVNVLNFDGQPTIPMSIPVSLTPWLTLEDLDRNDDLLAISKQAKARDERCHQEPLEVNEVIFDLREPHHQPRRFTDSDLLFSKYPQDTFTHLKLTFRKRTRIYISDMRSTKEELFAIAEYNEKRIGASIVPGGYKKVGSIYTAQNNHTEPLTNAPMIYHCGGIDPWYDPEAGKLINGDRCFVSYLLPGDVYVEYSFSFEAVPSVNWRTLDKEIRNFSLSLVDQGYLQNWSQKRGDNK